MNGGTTKSIDWNEIHRRIDCAGKALEQGFAFSQEAKRNILKERAKALAKVPARREAEGIDILEFALANETYAIETAYVREVYPLKELTPLPATPPFVSGIISVRGQVLSVIDIKKLFDLPETGLADLRKVVIARHGAMELGILADEVFGVRSIPLAEIGAPLPTLTGIQAEYIRGVTKEALIILDVAKMLTDQKIVVHVQ